MVNSQNSTSFWQAELLSYSVSAGEPPLGCNCNNRMPGTDENDSQASWLNILFVANFSFVKICGFPIGANLTIHVKMFPSKMSTFSFATVSLLSLPLSLSPMNVQVDFMYCWTWYSAIWPTTPNFNNRKKMVVFEMCSHLARNKSKMLKYVKTHRHFEAH